jgi:hypothetical protein
MSMRLAGLGIAAILAAIMFAPAPGTAAPLVVIDKGTQVSDLQSVGYKRRYWRKYDRDDDGNTYVRAPFAEVDTHGGTWVAAPFARVYSDRYGTWVRAPFVNLWRPRD